MPEGQLHYLIRDSLDAGSALKAFVDLLKKQQPLIEATAVGLFYSPTRCRMGLLHPDGAPSDELGQIFPLFDVFELRAFHPTMELRWLHNKAGLGRAAILGEAPKTAAPQDWTTLTAKPYLDTIDQHYLLWGTAEASHDLAQGWTRLRERRIRPLLAPFKAAPGQRVKLDAKEYLADGDEDGNVVVIEQRLIGLSLCEK